MTDTIYPAIVPGLKVRHRETLKERTVKRISYHGIVAMEETYSTEEKHFWEVYEPLPQPGDRVRVVRDATGDHEACIGTEGVLGDLDAVGDSDVDDIHYGPLSDFEVILPEESELPEPVESMLLDDRGEMPGLPPESDATPDEAFDLGRIAGYDEAMRDVLAEESETNMTDNETVAVPVELLHRATFALGGTADNGAREDLLALIPKPKPRLVAVNLDDGSRSSDGYRIEFDAQDLDAEPDLLETLDGVIDQFTSSVFSRDTLKAAIRAALGVHDE